MNKTGILAIAAGAALAFGSANAVAHEQGDWLMRFGVSYADPKSDNSDLVSVDGAASATINWAYMMSDHVAVELLAAYPFEHDIDLVSGGQVASTKHLPPTLSVQYHFLPDAAFQPYVGVGLNYTNFFSEDTEGALAGSDLGLDSSWGLALQLGADVPLTDRWFLNVDVRWIDIDTDATLDGAALGSVEIDPLVYGAHLGFRF